jgi:hypothetical protein
MTAAEYLFAVEFEVDPSADDPTLRLEPAVVETTPSRRAPDPGTDGWRFFRDTLRRGEVNENDHERLRADAAAALGAALDVRSVEFRELRTDETYLEALRSAIAADLGAFDADDIDEVVRKYLGSRAHVREP